MIVFIFFKLLMFAYSFSKETEDFCSAIFAFFSCLEFAFVTAAVVANFQEIANYVKGLCKK